MKNKHKQENIVYVGYPFYSENKIYSENKTSLDTFKLHDNINLEMLTTVIEILVILSFSTVFIMTSRSALALTMDSVPRFSNPEYYGEPSYPSYPEYYQEPSNPATSKQLPKGFRFVLMVSDFFGARILGGELLWTPSQSMSWGYFMGCVMSWIIKFI